jgi:hypothetical protein
MSAYVTKLSCTYAHLWAWHSMTLLISAIKHSNEDGELIQSLTNNQLKYKEALWKNQKKKYKVERKT